MSELGGLSWMVLDALSSSLTSNPQYNLQSQVGVLKGYNFPGFNGRIPTNASPGFSNRNPKRQRCLRLSEAQQREWDKMIQASRHP